MHALPPLIDNDAALQTLCEGLADVERVAIDTEFVRDRTYYPSLCLMQLASDHGLSLVDPLADLDLAPLFAALARPGLVKILHAARQDLEIFFLLAGAVPDNIFDTQLAAACMGYGEQLSYSNLAEALLGVDLGKSHARTDWARRPLADAQLRYAADDVLYLLKIYDDLNDQLMRTRRDAWLAHEFKALSDAGLYAPRPDLAYRRIRAQKNLTSLRRARLAALAEWREQIAMRKNLPRRWVVADKPLLDLAALDGTDPDALTKVPGLPDKLLKRERETLCALLRGADGQADDYAESASRPTAAENRAVKKMTELVRAEAETLRTSPALLATRSDLLSLVRGETENNPITQGWRHEVIGAKLLQLLDSHRTTP